MDKAIESVQIVSDGIMVRFSDGMLTYFPQGFLRANVGIGSNQIFLDYDPSEPHTEQSSRTVVQ